MKKYLLSFLFISFLASVSLVGGLRDIPVGMTFSKKNDELWSFNVFLGANAAAALGSWYATDKTFKKTNSPLVSQITGFLFGMASGASVLVANNVFNTVIARRSLTRDVFTLPEAPMCSCIFVSEFVTKMTIPQPKKASQGASFTVPREDLYHRQVDYALLGLDPDEVVTREEVDRAFRKISPGYHPDNNRHLSQEDQAHQQRNFTIINNARDRILKYLENGKKY